MLKTRQYTILRFIYQYTSENGFAPSIREIGCTAQITSTSVVNYHIERLMVLGYLVKSPGKSRTFTLTHKALELFEDNHPATDVARLQEEIRLLKAENEHLRLEHKTQLTALRREYAHLVQ
jgi:SOS-response transcriptional repressor LexA